MRYVKGYEGLYAVTSCGKVWDCLNRRFIVSTRNTYRAVNLYDKDGNKKRFYIHRLVAEAYIPNPDNLPLVNHKDEVKYHNWVNNLEWCTYSYNINYGTANARRSKTHKLNNS